MWRLLIESHTWHGDFRMRRGLSIGYCGRVGREGKVCSTVPPELSLGFPNLEALPGQIDYEPVLTLS